jgi:hypothetical protein
MGCAGGIIDVKRHISSIFLYSRELLCQAPEGVIRNREESDEAAEGEKGV